MEKFFYLHIPKTAGNFFNIFLSNQFKNSFIDHIEIKFNLNLSSNIENLKTFRCFSGHILYPYYKNKIKEHRKVITLLRIPMEQLVSHITFVRELAEESERERFLSHSKVIQEIALKLKSVNLGNYKDIEHFINWLENNKIWLFHDCQTRYLGGGNGKLTPLNLQNALKNLEEIDYVGLTERIKEFLIFLNLKENFKLIEVKRENVTKNRYGLNINDEKIRTVLRNLIMNDLIVYQFARKKFINIFYNEVLKRELRMGPRYSLIRVEQLFNELKKEEKGD